MRPLGHTCRPAYREGESLGPEVGSGPLWEFEGTELSTGSGLQRATVVYHLTQIGGECTVLLHEFWGPSAPRAHKRRALLRPTSPDRGVVEEGLLPVAAEQGRGICASGASRQMLRQLCRVP